MDLKTGPQFIGIFIFRITVNSIERRYTDAKTTTRRTRQSILNRYQRICLY